MPGIEGSPPSAVAILAPVLGSATARKVLWGVAAVLWAAMVLVQVRRANPLGWLDLRVYRDSFHAFVGGRPLYSLRVTEADLPFTYPPVAILALAPLAWLPFPLSAATLLVLSGAAVLLTCWSCLQPLAGGRPTLAAAAAVAGAALFLQPVWSALNYGQIDLLLTAAVTVDMLVVPPRYRGVLTGLLAAVKLTPLVFLLLLALRRDWSSAVRVVGTFVAVSLVGAVALPHQSVEYWFHALRDPARIGPPAYVGNLSTNGVLERFWGDGSATKVVWLVLAALVLVATVVVVRAALALGYVLVPLAVVALAGLLCSPIAWDHHWAWTVVLAFALVEVWTWSRAAAVVGGVLVLATAVQNPKWLDAAQQAGTLSGVQRYLVTNLWVYLAYALLAVLVWVSASRAQPQMEPQPRRPRPGMPT